MESNESEFVSEYIPYDVYCFLCNKKFATKRNLKIHEERLHQVCKKPTFTCNFCHTGFDDYHLFQDHHSARLKRTLSKKIRKKNDPDNNKTPQLVFAKKIKKELPTSEDLPNNDNETDSHHSPSPDQ